MIDRLRIRFFVTAILSVLAVLAVLIGGINIFNYRNVVSDADEVLQILTDNGGHFPESQDRNHNGIPPYERRMRRIDSPELAFESRYFSVITGIDGSAGITDMRRISAVSEDEAKEYAARVMSGGRNHGFIGEYRYAVRGMDDGSTLVVFLDCGPGLMNFRSFLKISLIISIIGLLLVGLIIFFISGKVIRPVAESYEKQKRFITDAGHEIKTPLAIINADTDVLEMDIGEGNEWIADIKKQTRRLTELTNDLIYLSKMEEGSFALNMEDIDLSDVVENQAGSFKARAATGEICFGTDIRSDVHIRADKKSVEGLISILLDNAVKYCPAGGNIDLKLSSGPTYARIDITNDTEEDIPVDDLKHLGERFYRTDKSRNSKTGGHGIGLSMATAIAHANGGRISYGKRKQRSLSVTVSLPVNTKGN